MTQSISNRIGIPGGAGRFAVLRLLPPFLTAYLCMLVGAPYLVFSTIDGGSIYEKAGESGPYKVVWIALYLLLLAHLAQNAPTVGILLRRRVVWFIFILSGLFSYVLFPPDDPAIIVKFAMYVFTMLFGLWLATAVTVDRFFNTVFSLGVVILVAHWAVYPLVAGSMNYDLGQRTTLLGTMSYGGLFGHKNLAGAYFGFATVVTLCRLLAMPRKRTFTGIVLAAQFTTLIATGAIGGLLSSVAAGIVTVGVHLTIKRSPLAAVWWYSLFGAGLIIAVLGYVVFVESLGRDGGFTGRSFLLEAWPEFFLQRPWFGYGYARFFAEGPDSFADQLASMARYGRYYTFESSFLEMAIAFGAVGASLLIAVLTRAVATAWRYLRFDQQSLYHLAPFAVILFITCSSLADTYLVLHNHLYPAIVFWLYFGLRAPRIAPHLQPHAQAIA